MNWSETSLLAAEALRSNKVRTVLTILGVIIGSASIVLVVTIALTGKSYILAQMEAVGSNIVFAFLAQSSFSHNVSVADQIPPADLDAVRRIPHVVQVAGTNDIPLNVVAARTIRPVSLIGVTQGFQQTRKLIIVRGRYFDETDFPTVGKLCLISEHLAQNALPGSDQLIEKHAA